MEKLEDSYQNSIDFNGGLLRIDLNFEKKTADPSAMEKVKGFIDRIDEFYSLNSAHLINDYEHGQLIREYIEFHLEELQKDKLDRLVDYGNKDITLEKQLYNRLKLERIGLYPEEAYQECFAVFDYTLEGNVYIDGRRTVTDQIIAVKTDENGNLERITWES